MPFAREVIAWLPVRDGTPVPSPEAMIGNGGDTSQSPVTAGKRDISHSPVAAGRSELWPWLLEGVALSRQQAVSWLLRLTDPALRTPQRLGIDLGYWPKAAWLALRLAAAQHFVPGFLPGAYGRSRQTSEDGAVRKLASRGRAVWLKVFDGADKEWLQQLMDSMPAVCQSLLLRPPRAAKGSAAHQPPVFSDAQARLDSSLAAAVDALVRDSIKASAGLGAHAASAALGPHAARAARAPYAAAGASTGHGRRRSAAGGTAPLHLRWGAALVAPDRRITCTAAEAEALASALAAWASPVLQPTQADPLRVCFRLDEPVEEEQASGWALRFFLQAAAEPSLLVPAAEVWRSRGKVLRYLNRRFENVQERLLRGLGQAARLCPAVAESLSEPNPTEARLTTAEAYRFLTDTAPCWRTAALACCCRLGGRRGPRGPALA